MKTGTDETTNPSFSVDLADLFPFLKVHQLALYLIDSPIAIELTFYPTVGQRIQIVEGTTEDIACEIVRDDLKFHKQCLQLFLLRFEYADRP